eukprot:COSAG02_NODE_7441_length_3011_cov_8.016827_3_plen_32_part_01
MCVVSIVRERTRPASRAAGAAPAMSARARGAA